VVQFGSLSGFNGPPFRGSGRIRVRLGLRLGLELAIGLGMDEPQCIILRNGGPKSGKCCYFVVRVRCRKKVDVLCLIS